MRGSHTIINVTTQGLMSL